MLYLIYDHSDTVFIKPSPAIKLAVPFSDDKWSLPYDDTQSDEEEDEGRNGEEYAMENPGALRITTRANIPYNLEGYTKNAMLLLNTTAGYPRGYDRHVPDKMATVANAFANFRFEIEQHVDLSDDEVDEKCRDFLQRDFTNYGCVAVVLLKPDGCKIEDTVVVRHWIENGNPTLRDKPKLYINESSHYYAFRRGYSAPYYTVPITDGHPDVLCLHLPAIFDNDHVPQPLNIFCNKLTSMADEHLMTIVKETLLDMKPMFRPLTFIATTQNRKLFLARTP